MADEHPADQDGVRLQKVLAGAGVASRRAAEALIEEGRVEVNGALVTEQGRRVDPERDVIRVDGSRIPPPRRHRYVVINKPRGVVTTMDDPQGRRTVADLLESRERLFHVGRLDAETQGLLIMTNDGEFAHRMSHPSHEVDKTYLAEVRGLVDRATLRRLADGVELEDGPVRPDRVKIVSTSAENTLLRVVLHEGRNRIVRRMFDEIGHPVRKLSRTAIGPVRLGRLKPGESRDLTREELGALLDRVGL
ncbi:23S rRNA pseudouridine2605 synthase [Naumannella cuiyingiana]|uniref:Pseudouridine synthase n=1 Tax=Naumannella cuiyingiana TaxID=1347891 RepID=A0A7Z0IM67_9ACTN|nr:pseudouridine synthase [Naumannella cuiyingiana]NYI72424.1 23S rRNA pseudouridine2605 synthase [Naumannella cuiyingiana]